MNFVSKVLYQYRIFVNTKLVLIHIFFPRFAEISPSVQFILQNNGGIIIMKRSCIMNLKSCISFPWQLEFQRAVHSLIEVSKMLHLKHTLVVMSFFTMIYFSLAWLLTILVKLSMKVSEIPHASL